MGESFADLRRRSREPGQTEPSIIERKRGGNVPFSVGEAAVSNARRLEAKGDISERESAGVERSVARGAKNDRHVITGKPAEREKVAMEKAAADRKTKAIKLARSTKG